MTTLHMHNPASPGELLSGWLEDLQMTVTSFAAHIGTSRVMLSRVVNGRSAISADMDLRLSEAWATTPGHWLTLQQQRDLWAAQQLAKKRKRIKPLTPARKNTR